MMKINKRLLLVLIITAFQMLFPTTITYVTVEGTGSQDGTSWDNAMPGDSLQTAIIHTYGFNKEVWVAKGVYKPNSWPNNDGENTERDKHFVIYYGVYGGFNGTETDISQRDIKKNETILSGDIGVEGDNSDNCYNVIKVSNFIFLPEYNHIIDGFTITGGNSNSDWGYGAGMLYTSSAPTIRNCTFRNNHSISGGGAVANMFNYDTSIIIENCLFYD
ncbi:MAG: hypothetical protein KKD38_05045, partial [Candidatus Delongbacteria bacterium]|nr:hypothetical protein [Candidatus Delongbacteria bacterium]